MGQAIPGSEGSSASKHANKRKRRMEVSRGPELSRHLASLLCLVAFPFKPWLNGRHPPNRRQRHEGDKKDVRPLALNPVTG